MKIGRVYKIITTRGNECYVGSTFNTTRDRFKGHKADYSKWKNGNGHFKSSFELFEKYGVENCRCIVIKEYLVCDRDHLEAYEQLWVSKLKAMNRQMPFSIRRLYKKAYREEHKEELQQKKKAYREENKDKIAERTKNYREQNKEIIKGKKSQKVRCEICDVDISKNHIRRHERSQKHLSNLQPLQEQ